MKIKSILLVSLLSIFGIFGLTACQTSPQPEQQDLGLEALIDGSNVWKEISALRAYHSFATDRITYLNLRNAANNALQAAYTADPEQKKALYTSTKIRMGFYVERVKYLYRQGQLSLEAKQIVLPKARRILRVLEPLSQ
ncbi:MAG: hypothetical protein KC422_11115 [Trueperaceae bacterium]|nr:hypothetical protein [Trueperaceae bacterium]